MEREVFRNFLRDRGLKFTKERGIILEEVSSLKRHFDIDEFFRVLRKKLHKVSRASLYRTIPLLVECGLVDEIKTLDTHTYYEYSYGREHHDHLICLNCGTVIEFHSEKLEQLQNEICVHADFRGIRHVLEVQGYCQNCSGPS
jgi:Fur family ferric uptake transcriptional regulator